MSMNRKYKLKQNLELGDLVYYNDIYVIPPDAVNWKFQERDSEDRLAIVLEII